MGYHDLSECTLTPDERIAEMLRITTRLEDVFDSLTPTEAKFVSQIQTSNYVSVKQLFWLRDINEKY